MPAADGEFLFSTVTEAPQYLWRECNPILWETANTVGCKNTAHCSKALSQHQKMPEKGIYTGDITAQLQCPHQKTHYLYLPLTSFSAPLALESLKNSVKLVWMLLCPKISGELSSLNSTCEHDYQMHCSRVWSSVALSKAFVPHDHGSYQTEVCTPWSKLIIFSWKKTLQCELLWSRIKFLQGDFFLIKFYNRDTFAQRWMGNC